VYTRPGELNLFISGVSNLSFGKDDVINWTPGNMKSFKYAQDELEKHKKSLKNLPSK